MIFLFLEIDSKFFDTQSFNCHPGNRSAFYDSAKLREEDFQENPIIVSIMTCMH
jgi:hypothetical protein